MSGSPSSRATGGDPASTEQPSSIKHRPSWIAFVVLGSIFCLGMGGWQLARYQEASGTVQNLGYTFMWPFLAGFLIYAYLKYVRLEADEADRTSDTSQPATESASEDVRAGPDAGHDDDDAPDTRPAPLATGSSIRSARRGRRRGPVVTEIPADLLPTRRPTKDAQARDEGLAAYNSYLAELARQDRVGEHPQEKSAS